MSEGYTKRFGDKEAKKRIVLDAYARILKADPDMKKTAAYKQAGRSAHVSGRTVQKFLKEK